MFILYRGHVEAMIQNTGNLTCRQVHDIITSHDNDSAERAALGFFDVCKKSVQVQRTAKRSQFSDTYYKYLAESGRLRPIRK